MELEHLLNYVIPSNGVLYKHCNGGWDFYKTDDHFINGNSYMNQATTENFHQFAERLVDKLMEDEKDDEERLVAIDYAIWSNH